MRVLATILFSATIAAACTSARQANDNNAVPSTSGATPELPAGATGKISAAQVGRISPVPAFKGGGSDWQIEIQATGDFRHDVQLTWGDRSARGTLIYDRERNAAAPATIVLDGTLHADTGDVAMAVVIERGDCRDAEGHAHRQRVRVTVEGMAPLQSCGDLAMY